MVIGSPSDLMGLPNPLRPPPHLTPGEEDRKRGSLTQWMSPEPPAWWSWQPPAGLTLRTDTRKMQGSSRPVAGLALILHTKVNLFRHRTQFSRTSSLRAQGGVHVQGGEGPAHRRGCQGELSLFTLCHKVTAVS